MHNPGELLAGEQILLEAVSKQEGTAHLKVGHHLTQIGMLVSRAFPQDSRVCLVEKMTMVQDLEGSRFFGNVLTGGKQGEQQGTSPAELNQMPDEMLKLLFLQIIKEIPTHDDVKLGVFPIRKEVFKNRLVAKAVLW